MHVVIHVIHQLYVIFPLLNAETSSLKMQCLRSDSIAPVSGLIAQ